MANSNQVDARPDRGTGLVAGHQLDGVALCPLDGRHDERGTFTEVYSADRHAGPVPLQWSLVRSGAGVLRGMHFHRRHHEAVHCVSGHMSVGLHDLRRHSATAGRWSLYELADDQPALLVFPPGIVHGWLFHEPSLHLQGVTEPYSSYGGDDNLGCRFDDPALGIPWPFTPSVVSERARGFPPLAELAAAIGS